MKKNLPWHVMILREINRHVDKIPAFGINAKTQKRLHLML